MTRLFYSYMDGRIYLLSEKCDLETLMKEQAGDCGILICASKGLFEMVEYDNGQETRFKTTVITDGDEIDSYRKVASVCLRAFF